MSRIKDDTISGIKWSAIGRFSVQGVNFLLGLLMARLLTPEDYGTIGMLGIFMAIAGTFVDSGFSNALIRKIDRTETDFSTAFYFNIVVGLVCYGILFIVAPYIAIFFNTPILKDVVRVISLNIFINSLTIVQNAKLTIELDFKAQAKISLIATFVSGIFGLILAYTGFGVWALAFQSVTYNILSAILLWIVTKWRPTASFSKTSFLNLFSFGSKLLASGLLHTLYSNATTLVIGKYYTSKDLGYYSRGEQFASLPSMNITGILQRVTFPIFSKLQTDDSRLIQVYRKYICISSMIIFFGMFLLTALAKPIIVTILTDKWSNSIIYLQVFCFALMFDHLCQLNLNLLQVKGHSGLFLRLEIIKKIISLAILIAAIPFGVFAICVSKVIYTQIAVYINTYYTGKLFGLGYIAQIKDFSKYFIYSIVAAFFAYLLTLTPLPHLLNICLGSSIAVGVYLYLLRKDIYMLEVLELTKPYFHKVLKR
jgi:O-antigen/teichoic acid export membrane protein